MLYTPDHPGLFSQFAGAIAVSGGSIVDAKAFTTSDGFALDVFSVQDAGGRGRSAMRERLERLRQTIEKTLRGEVLPRASWLAKRRAQATRQRLQDQARECISTTRPRASPP